jgi:hypothetical protein
MARTYSIFTNDNTFSLNKNMLSVFNGNGSGKVIRLYRIFILNNQINAISGVLTKLDIRRISSLSAGIDVSIIPHDTSYPALPSEIIARSGGNSTLGAIVKSFLWSTDEITGNTTMTIDEFESIPPICEVWNHGYYNVNDKPLTLRNNEGVALMAPGASTGSCDIRFEITVEDI